MAFWSTLPGDTAGQIPSGLQTASPPGVQVHCWALAVGRASWLKLGLARRGCYPPGVPLNLWKAKATSTAQSQKGGQVSCLLSVFLPDVKMRCHKVVSRTEARMSWKTQYKWFFCMLSLVPLTSESQSARFCPSVILPVSVRSDTKEKLSLKAAGKWLERVHITVVDLWTWVRGRNWGLPACHPSKGDALVSACAAQQKQMPSGNLQKRGKAFRPCSVKCHYTKALKQSMQHKITQELPNVVASTLPNINTFFFFPQFRAKT